MFIRTCLYVSLAVLGFGVCRADSLVRTPRPVPATRPEMKQLLEDMKNRPHRIPLPELTDKEKAELGERSSSYEARLRFNYVPAAEGSVFGSGRPRTVTTPAGTPGEASAPRTDFTRNADENMTLTYQFKTMLFWIVSRTNNCQYCLGHQEWKLSATGMKDDAIAALDADWSSHSEAEQAAFAYARLLTFEPHLLSDDEIAKVAKHYTALQILEMTMSVAGNNAINRWKEGTGIPQSSGNTFTGRGGPGAPAAAAGHSDSFVTPTSDKFRNAVSIVAPLAVIDGKPAGLGLSTRPALETRDEVKTRLADAVSRTSRLTLVDEAIAQAWLNESGLDIPPSNWVRLLASFPNEGRGRLPSLSSRERQTGDLTELRKAQLNWIIARQDRAWYAVGQAYQKLQSLGQTEDQIFALDGDWKEFSEGDQSLFTFAKHLAASPIALTDEDAALALKLTSPRQVVQTINHVASCAYFDRVTEAASLPLRSEPPVPGPELLKYTPEQIEAAYEGREMPEAVSMYLVIARDGQLDGGNGWFGPAQSRFSYSWLAERNGVAPDEPLPADKFQSPESIFKQLDRDHDGQITASDLDWSDRNPWVQQANLIGRIFRRIDPGGDGKLTKEEWNAFFEETAGDRESIRSDQLRDALIPPGSGFSPGDMPGKETLIRGLMAGEIGSLQEGPNVDQPAPDFDLRPLAGGDPVRLSTRIGTKPVVLVFGNFTCGPFRSIYPAVEAVRERRKDNADFLMVYVREAHPTDGWAMKSNEKVGVAVAQPTTFEERRSVAAQCAAKLNPSMPLLVDDMSDTVGNSYSGMPARLYVIDTNGKVAYKSGRGPFGFKPEEMEQALLMLLLEEGHREQVLE